MKDSNTTSHDLDVLVACYEQVIYDLSEQNAKLMAQERRRQKRKKT